MPDASRPVFLRHFRRGAKPRGPDLADMGTAFGLDEAIEFCGGDTPAQIDAQPCVTSAVPVAAWRAWLGRKLGA